MRYATCSVSTEHTEQQSNRATEHSAGHVTTCSVVLAAGRDERRRYLTFCLRPYHKYIADSMRQNLSRIRAGRLRETLISAAIGR